MEIQPPSSIAQATARFTGLTNQQVQDSIRRIYPLRPIDTNIFSQNTKAAVSSTGGGTDYRESEHIEAHRILQGVVTNPWNSIHDIEVGKTDPFYKDSGASDIKDIIQHTIGHVTGAPDPHDPRYSFVDNLLKMKMYQKNMDNYHSYDYMKNLFLAQVEKGSTYYQTQAMRQNEEMSKQMMDRLESTPVLNHHTILKSTPINGGMVTPHKQRSREIFVNPTPYQQMNTKRKRLDDLHARFSARVPYERPPSPPAPAAPAAPAPAAPAPAQPHAPPPPPNAPFLTPQFYENAAYAGNLARTGAGAVFTGAGQALQAAWAGANAYDQQIGREMDLLYGYDTGAPADGGDGGAPPATPGGPPATPGAGGGDGGGGGGPPATPATGGRGGRGRGGGGGGGPPATPAATAAATPGAPLRSHQPEVDQVNRVVNQPIAPPTFIPFVPGQQEREFALSQIAELVENHRAEEEYIERTKRQTEQMRQRTQEIEAALETSRNRMNEANRLYSIHPKGSPAPITPVNSGSTPVTVWQPVSENLQQTRQQFNNPVATGAGPTQNPQRSSRFRNMDPTTLFNTEPPNGGSLHGGYGLGDY